MVKFKPKLERTHIVSILVLIFVAVSVHATATPNNFGRTESTNVSKTEHVSAQQDGAVKQAENALDVNTSISGELEVESTPIAAPEPTPPVIDPNGCEAKGMWYRADNNECLPKEVSATPAASVGTAPTVGTGDCSLVNNYDWPHDVAMRVCMQESGGDPNTKNLHDYHEFANCWGSFGLMEINCSHGEVYNGAENMAIAYQMWLGAGRTFWSGWTHTCEKVGC